jgi:transcriptional regulator with XRE-family HTH domain
MFSGEMTEMRKRLGLSKAALADILGISVTSLYRWESYGALDQLNERNAEAVAAFMEAGTKALDEFPDFAERFTTLGQGAQKLGLTQEWVLHLTRTGQLKSHDFGVLGLFVTW